MRNIFTNIDSFNDKFIKIEFSSQLALVQLFFFLAFVQLAFRSVLSSIIGIVCARSAEVMGSVRSLISVASFDSVIELKVVETAFI